MKKYLNFRTLIQLSVFVLLFFLSYSHLKYGVEKAAAIDAYCPYGAAESFITKITTGEYLKRIWTSSFILMIITIITTLLFGRIFCAYLCPLGALQEWLRALGRKIGFKKDLELPAIIDKYARYIKYFLLLIIIYFSYQLGDLFFRNYDPYNALMHFGNEFEEKIIAYIILAVILISALISKNWWCRYFCPMGAFLGIIKKISPVKINRNSSTCTSCGLCRTVCPANLNVDKADITNSADCISCLNCVNDCPTNSLNINIINKKISKKIFSIIVVFTFFLPLLIIMTTPLWQTKAPSNVVTSNGKIDVANIRGSNTLKKVIEETGIPLETFIRELKLPENIDTSLMLRDIGIKYNLTNTAGAILETQDFRDLIDQEINKK